MVDMSQNTSKSASSSSTKSQASPKTQGSKRWYNDLNPWHKEDTRPEWQRKRDERFKQWEKDNSTNGGTTKYMSQFYKPDYKMDGKTHRNKGAWGWWLDIFA